MHLGIAFNVVTEGRSRINNSSPVEQRTARGPVEGYLTLSHACILRHGQGTLSQGKRKKEKQDETRPGKTRQKRKNEALSSCVVSQRNEIAELLFTFESMNQHQVRMSKAKRLGQAVRGNKINLVSNFPSHQKRSPVVGTEESPG